MKEIRETQKKYCSRALTFSLIAGFVFFLAGMTPICKGLILGTLFSIVNFIIMGETLPMRINRSRGKTFFTALGSIFFRYLLLAVPIFVAIKYEQFNLFAAIAGIFLVQMAILFDHLFGLIMSNSRKRA